MLAQLPSVSTDSILSNEVAESEDCNEHTRADNPTLVVNTNRYQTHHVIALLLYETLIGEI